ncbi:tRNA (adenine(22)-N(1))-methyltransferase TrmK [Lactiplantibacillus plantarum]|uniref:tRNA (adenine(22)-N(1))-methyltransferase n=1 Tax=Lactiplantibacillus plantarum TaxID=1590 RepID=UPI0018A1123C|nr:tRNA (adenine(22)-N(1))-methyltransferase TrmK [Lactiplantibacillus plantarum]MDB7776569.1 tRNA (adenine(22)-N(1))-methyltransferase TrmK [Lactiplantibacillus plantarum]MDB7785546.1 tRNA (adenine(22)-N(1))-methyltransferase TrmK [Lactiplantibacillus plantarum]MDB7788607.1 tRNA (adenine(22)-N(1))-methyltransferase TrmK [Lactiplantibacillus plantarum]
MDAKQLSKRLATVGAFVQPGARVADIGSDHAYLPANLALNHQISYGVAGEVVRGPFENTRHEIQKLGLTDRLVARLADGLAAIEPADRIDTVTIAGMGGPLIRHILEQGPTQLAGVQRLVLEPNVGEATVREWLAANQFQIVAERILAEDGHTYEILCADRVDHQVTYTTAEQMFGPFLLAEKSPVFIAKWQRELQRVNAAVAQMQRAKVIPEEQLALAHAKIKLIEGVLTDASK